MNNETASERHSQISQEFADQAFEINREVEAHYEDDRARMEASEAVRRPASLQVMPPLSHPSFERVAAAAAEDRLRVEAEGRRTIGDQPDLINHAPEVAENRWSWRRIYEWFAARYAEPSLPARY